MDIPVELSRILITELGDQQVIFLREKDGDRNFPILIGIAEALAIDHRLKHRPTPRPMTHELLANVIQSLGATIEKVVVNDIRNHTFIATIHLRQNGRAITIDARPSDAIALGVAFDTPLFVAEKVFASATHEPSTPEERLELLRKRQQELAYRIEQLSEVLETPEYLEHIPEAQVDQYRQQLQEMEHEYDAIERILRKLG